VSEGQAPLESLREAIDALAAEGAPELVAEARAEATARVRSMLAEAIAESLLSHSAAELRPRAGTTPAKAPARRPTPRPRAKAPTENRESRREDPVGRDRPRPAQGEHGYYVYGVVSSRGATLPADLAGVDPRHPATLVEDHGLAAIVSRVPLDEFGEEQLHENLNDVEWLEDKARTHEEVLDAALSRTTVVPLRLCTIYRDEAQVREMLAGERELFLDAIERLGGKTEWGVKLIAEPGALQRAASSGDTESSQEEDASKGTAYMNRKRDEARERDEGDQLAEEWTRAVHERLADIAAEALLNPVQRAEVSGHVGEMLLNGVYLVDDREMEPFRERVDQLAAEFAEVGATVELTGPWPPYNFVKSSIEAAR
jgi:hypothetical protein